MIRPVPSTSVEISGADTTAGSTPSRRRIRGSARELVCRLREIAELVVDDAEVVMQETAIEPCRGSLAVAQQRRAINAGAHQLVALTHELGRRLGGRLAA